MSLVNLLLLLLLLLQISDLLSVFPEDIFVLETKDPQNPSIYGIFSTSR